MHRSSFAHRDIKPHNVLVRRQRPLQAVDLPNSSVSAAAWDSGNHNVDTASERDPLQLPGAWDRSSHHAVLMVQPSLTPPFMLKQLLNSVLTSSVQMFSDVPVMPDRHISVQMVGPDERHLCRQVLQVKAVLASKQARISYASDVHRILGAPDKQEWRCKTVSRRCVSKRMQRPTAARHTVHQNCLMFHRSVSWMSASTSGPWAACCTSSCMASLPLSG